MKCINFAKCLKSTSTFYQTVYRILSISYGQSVLEQDFYWRTNYGLYNVENQKILKESHLKLIQYDSYMIVILHGQRNHKIHRPRFQELKALIGKGLSLNGLILTLFRCIFISSMAKKVDIGQSQF